jgi:hypothetical protein
VSGIGSSTLAGSSWPETQLEAVSMNTFNASEECVGAEATG